MRPLLLRSPWAAEADFYQTPNLSACIAGCSRTGGGNKRSLTLSPAIMMMLSAMCSPTKLFMASSPKTVPPRLRDTTASDAVCTAPKQILRRSRASCRSHGGQRLQGARMVGALSGSGRPIVVDAASETRLMAPPALCFTQPQPIAH